MDAKTIAAISEVQMFNTLSDLADVMDRGAMKGAANDVRECALKRLEAATKKLAST